jgi:hypothetical protein
MASATTQLLRLLEPSVRPGFAAPAAIKGVEPLEQRSFSQLLSAAATGDVRSGRQVQLACEPSPPLSAAQLERLAAAGDLAEASGSRRALMMLDGRGLVMDVSSRTILAELSPDESSRMFQVDSTIYVARDDESQFQGLLPPPGAAVDLSRFLGTGAATDSARSRKRPTDL